MTTKDSVSNLLDTVTAVIATGTSLSGDLNLGGLRLFGIVMPASWTTANLSFQASVDGVVWNNLYDAFGAEVSVIAAASRLVRLDGVDFSALPFLRVRSGLASAPVTQASDAALTLVLRAV